MQFLSTLLVDQTPPPSCVAELPTSVQLFRSPKYAPPPRSAVFPMIKQLLWAQNIVPPPALPLTTQELSVAPVAPRLRLLRMTEFHICIADQGIANTKG